MTIEIRTIAPDEFTAWVEALHVPFFMTVPAGPAAEARRPHTDLARLIAAFDRGRIVGTFRSLATELTIPGGRTVPAAAVTAVTVLPTHRRRGLLTGMMMAGLKGAVERGEPVSILIASEYPIYGRFGFGSAADGASYRIDTRAARFASVGSSAASSAGARAGMTSGTVGLVDPAVLRKEALPVYERFRLAQPGSISRRLITWDERFGLVEAAGGRPRWQGWCLLAIDANGEPDGYSRYHVDEKWEDGLPKSTLLLDELVSASPGAYARLWRFLCEVDLVATIRAEDRSVDEPLPWLLEDARAVRQVMRSDFLWVRLLDPVRALVDRRYSAPGRLVLQVVDPQGFAAGRFALDGGPDGGDCRRTDAEPDLALPASSLGALYLGGVGARVLAAAGLVEERRAGAVVRADAMFRSDIAPWCNTWF